MSPNWRTRKSEQIRIASEFSRSLEEVEDKIQSIPGMPQNENERKNRYIQYLNQWKFFSLLINNRKISNKHIQEYFRPTLIRDYETIFSRYPELEGDKMSSKSSGNYIGNGEEIDGLFVGDKDRPCC
jgi:hypothetical protein